MTLKKHLLLLVGGAFFLLLLALGFALYSLQDSSRRVNELVEHEVAAQLAYTSLYAGGLQASSSLRGVVLDPKNQAGYTNLKKGLEDFDAALKSASAMRSTQSQKADAARQLEEMHQKRKALIGKALELVQSDAPGAISLLNAEEIPLWRKIRDVLLAQADAARMDVDLEKKDVAQAARRGLFISLGLMFVAVVMAAVSTVLIMRRLDRSLGGDPATVAAIAEAVAQGDLTHQIEDAVELSVLHSMQQMQRRLIEAVAKIRRNSERLTKASETLAANEHGVAERIQQQSDSLSEIAAAVEQLTTSIRVVADLGHETDAIAASSGAEAEKGAAAIGDVVAEMDVIQRTVGQAATVIEKLGQESDQIASIVETIRNIADQTNLLALNAAIEAARAGEAGRGFAVVADEVRKLAERTARSTQEIAGTIGKVRNGIGEAGSCMEEGVSSVARGRELAQSAGQIMQAILGSSSEVVRTVEEMAHSVKEQSTVSTQIAQRIESISLSAEANMAAVHDAVASTQDVSGLAEELDKSVQAFSLPA